MNHRDGGGLKEAAVDDIEKPVPAQELVAVSAVSHPEEAPKGRKKAPRGQRSAYVFMAPWFIGMIGFMVGPLIFSIFLSVSDWNLAGTPSWVGTANYEEMLTADYRFWQSLKVTGTYLLLSVPVNMVFGVAGAVLLNQKVWGIRMFRTILFLPSVLSGVATSVLWMQILNPESGVLNTLLRSMGVDNPPGWFNDPQWALPGMVIMGLWGAVGGGAIIYLAGLQNIGPHLYESASIDGANAVQRFFYVTLPMLTPTLFFQVLTGIIGAFQVFDSAYTIGGSGGGTSDSLLFYLLYLWQAGFRDGRFGYAAALSWFLVLIGSVIVVILMKTSDRWVHYEDGGQ